ncbi:hypothetical protein VCRA2122O12_290048 [Vibrio crassostreae]|nr:hypothetical protein VCRA2114E5_230069 [Vibrio crassostreae]CAK1927677.1 hypothetical protein VCRA2110O1_260069 [Vibrio crassostreae]CAK1954259.1 hypothetical protein VCRA2110O4_290008 [Vibrio crassostreae]CAK2689571.1 hypothetical protein VCRA2110O3_220068 [Vibrio crassostreae]CAK2749228.1 hypothetical protein VCRA2110O2_280047 [Vibrio crassostreae]
MSLKTVELLLLKIVRDEIVLGAVNSMQPSHRLGTILNILDKKR